MRLLGLWMIAIWLITGTVHAQNAGINREFGINGIASLRDFAQAANLDFQAVGACAGPGGSLNVVAETTTRGDFNFLSSTLTIFRLRQDGRLDPSFGNAGALTASVPAAYALRSRSACAPDGSMLIGREAQGLGNDGNLQLLKLSVNGTLDQAFASNGAVTVDMDEYASGLGDVESVRGINVQADGSIFLTAIVKMANNEFRAALVRLGSAGALVYAKVFTTLTIVTPITATAAGLAADGRIWLVGRGLPSNSTLSTWYRAEIAADTGAVLDISMGDPIAQGETFLGNGRVLSNGIMVVAAAQIVAGMSKPRLLVFRTSGFSSVDLPQPAPISNEGTPSINIGAGDMVSIPIAEGRVLYGANLIAYGVGSATYAAVVELGATAAADQVNTRFGVNGAQQFAFRTPLPCANGAPTMQRAIGFSNWLTRPVIAGVHATNCDSTSPQNAFVARLLAPDDMTISGFESGSSR